MKVISAVETVIDRALTKGSQNAALTSAVERAVLKRAPEPWEIDVFSARPIAFLFFTVLVAKFVKQEFENIIL